MTAARSFGGRRVPEALRRQLEPGLGIDLGDVQLHADARAGELADSVQARAFAVGSDVFFRDGELRPGSADGRRLIAHELAHVAQQRQRPDGGRPVVRRSVTVASSYPVASDIDPGPRRMGGDPSLGVTDPILNGNLLKGRRGRPVSPAQVFAALNKPTLAERSLDAIPRPNLHDPALDPVREGSAVVKRGDTKRKVELVQQALRAWARGLDQPFDPLPRFGVDGIFGGETEAAVQQFQRDKQLDDDGIVGSAETLPALDAALAALTGSVFTIDTLPANDFTGLIHVPAAPAAWTPVTSTAGVLNNVFTETAILVRCPKGTTTTATFVTTDSGFVAGVTAHEHLHEADQLKTINGHLVPWDTDLGIRSVLHTALRAPDAETATQMLFAGMNEGDPCALSNTIVQEWLSDNSAVHDAVPAPSISFSLDQACTKLTVSFGPPQSPLGGGTVPPPIACPAPPIALPTRQIPP